MWLCIIIIILEMNDSLDRFHQLIDYEKHLYIPKKNKISVSKKIFFLILIIFFLIIVSSFFMICNQVASLREAHSTLLSEQKKIEKRLISLKEDCIKYKKELDVKVKENENMQLTHNLIAENKHLTIEALINKIAQLRKRIKGYREEDKYLTEEIRSIHLNEIKKISN